MTISIFSGFSYCMLLMMQWLLIVVCCFSSLFPVSFSSLIAPIQHKCNSTELDALLHLKNEFQTTSCQNVSYDASAYPKTSTWNSKSLQWDGIHCDLQTGHVIGIDLSSSCLRGPFNSNSTLFSSLLDLQYLNLADNLFGDSTIPLELGNLSRLVYLNMSYSGFVGAIPIEISKLSKLSLLDLSINNFQGEFPASIFHLPNLQHLSIHNNDALQGYLPDFNSTTSRLETLQLYATNFSGSIPSSIGNLDSLRKLDMSSCKFSGTPPSSLGNLTQLIFLDLSVNNFAASNPMPNLSKLTMLKYLNLHDMNLEGEIPSTLANLTRLSVLNLYGNSLKGVIPYWFGNLTQLSNLELSYNYLSGSIPASIFHLPKLQLLSIHNNDALQGYLPDFNSTTSRLETIQLYRTNLSGNIPSSIGNLASLRMLYMCYCNFSGTPPYSLGNLTLLNYLDLSVNNFAASNPMPWLSKLTMLKYLYLYDINLEGEIPLSLANHTRLSVLYLHDNNLNGLLPSWLGNLTQLSHLDLSTNNLRGSIPYSLLSLPNITSIVLDNNYLNGQLEIDLFFQHEHLSIFSVRNNNLTIISRASSESYFKRSSLFLLDICYNMLQGSFPIPPPSVQVYAADYIESITRMLELPPTVCSLNSLVILTLRNSHLVGELPRCFENMSLQVLDLQNNYFHGSIPELCSQLRKISLNHNSFQGKLPRSLARCSNLMFLDVRNNYINDTFPSWLGSLPHLRVLAIKANAFHGSIEILEDNTTKFPELRIIDLSINKFSGNLPSRYFQGFDAMKSANLSSSSDTYLIEWTDFSGITYVYTYPVTLADKGMELEFWKISDALIAIDLSQNRFHGTIPRILGNLTGLHLLNLSYNLLTGPIPSSLAKLEQLQSLDLSSNRLSGEIPQQLSQLPFVSVFNVSYNYLIGLIPEGRQFDTFENISYLGNLGLCGKPLSRSCGNSTTPNHEAGTEMEKQNNSKLLLSTEHLVALIGFVGGLVFGVAMEDIIDWRRLIQSWIRKIRWSLRRN